jgi:tripartite-type tricarboxylate transporter receptor subunit TctC
MRGLAGLWLGALLLAATCAEAADTSSDFYRGRQITIIVGTDAGGSYDVAARLVSRYLGKYVPGHPAIIVQNMPGAGGVQALNNVANIAPQDGTVIGAPESGSALEPIFHLLSPGGSNAKFDGTKLQWIGSVEQANYLFAFWHDSPIHTFEDLKSREALVGASTPNADQFVFSTLVNQVFGTRMKIITGYRSSSEIALAMERGEVAGALDNFNSLMLDRPTWLEEHKVRVILRLSDTSIAALRDAPSALDLATSEDDRKVLQVVLAKSKMARPYFVASGVPQDRIATIRGAFLEMVKDPSYLDEAKRSGLVVNPISGEDVQTLIEGVYATPEPLLVRVRRIIGSQG